MNYEMVACRQPERMSHIRCYESSPLRQLKLLYRRVAEDAEDGLDSELGRATGLIFLGPPLGKPFALWWPTPPHRGHSRAAFNKESGSLRDKTRLGGCSLRLRVSAVKQLKFPRFHPSKLLFSMMLDDR